MHWLSWSAQALPDHIVKKSGQVEYSGWAGMAVFREQPGHRGIRGPSNLDRKAFCEMRKFIGFGAAAVALALGASACSSSPTTSSSPPPSTHQVADSTLTSLGTKTLAAGTADLHVDIAVHNPAAAGQPASTPLSGTITGPDNFTTNEAQLDIVLNGTVASIIGGPLNVTLANGTGYFPPPPTLARLLQLAPGKTYASLSLATLTGVLNLGPLGSAVAGNPAQLFDLFDSPAMTVTKVGPALINGHSTTEYAISVPLKKAAADGGASGTLFGEIAKGSPTLKDFTADVWVGASGRMRQLSLSLSGLAQSLVWNQGASISLTVGFSGFGKPVSVTVPPASEVQAVTSLP